MDGVISLYVCVRECEYCHQPFVQCVLYSDCYFIEAVQMLPSALQGHKVMEIGKLPCMLTIPTSYAVCLISPSSG